MRKLPVVAAIPNFNMATELERLLPQLIDQGYADIFVLDDASTDHSREVIKDFGNSVTLIVGEKNVGAGANRNRIIEALGYDALIHFMDADVVLESENAANLVRDIMPSGPVGFVGGLAKTREGRQSVWNYGPRPSLRNYVGSIVQARIGSLLATDKQAASRLRNKHAKLLTDWPNPLSEPTRREVYWNIEQNLVIASTTFAQLGGFDESLRETEISELAIRMHKLGLKNYFDPRLAVRHTEGQVRTYNRLISKNIEGFKIAHKHGFLNWLNPQDKFEV